MTQKLSCVGGMMDELKTLRKIAGLTQFQLSRRSGISRLRLSLSECGDLELTEEEKTSLQETLLRVLQERAVVINKVLDQVKQTAAP